VTSVVKIVIGNMWSLITHIGRHKNRLV